jgi:hypothetical protein
LIRKKAVKVSMIKAKTAERIMDAGREVNARDQLPIPIPDRSTLRCPGKSGLNDIRKVIRGAPGPFREWIGISLAMAELRPGISG